MRKKVWKFKIIRAHPGWTALNAPCGYSEDLFEAPVIAWRIEYEEDYEGEVASVHVTPITIYGDPDRGHALEAPDGRISKYLEEFSDREELLEDFKKEKAKSKNVES